MKLGHWAIRFTLTVLIFASFCSAAYADLYWESEIVTAGVPRQQDTTRLQKNYFISTASRTEPGEGKIVILDYAAKMLYALDPQTRTYTQKSLDELGMPPNMSKADQEMMLKKMSEMQEFKVSPTSETRTIAGYKCRKYDVTMPMGQGEYWVTKDTPGFQEFRAISAKFGESTSKNPMLRQMNIGAMVEKLDGFPVQTVTKMMGGTITTTLKKIEQKKLDPGLFKVPAGYALKEQ